jgi:hypothetical protein
MRFLFRLAFWLGIVVVLLPRSEQQAPSSTQMSASEAVAAAAAAVGDVSKFCDRQPEACVVGAQAAEALGDRARAGAERLYEMFNDRIAARDNDKAAAPGVMPVPLPRARPATRGQASAPPGSTRQAGPQDTLKPADLAPIWRGPAPRRDAREQAA